MKFEVGEIATFYKIGDEDHLKEVEIISSEFSYRNAMGYDAMILGSFCKRPDSKHGEWFIPTKYLRKKKPPQELFTWEQVQKDCNWNPQKVTA